MNAINNLRSTKTRKDLLEKLNKKRSKGKDNRKRTNQILENLG